MSNLTIYGVKYLSNLGNYFGDWLGVLLFSLIVGAGIYAFVKINSCKENVLDSARFYGFNISFIAVFFGGLLFVAKWVIFKDIILSSIFTVVFYSASIFVLTSVLIVLSRHVIKKIILKNIALLNACNNENAFVDAKVRIYKKVFGITGNKKEILEWVSKRNFVCAANDHAYLMMFYTDLRFANHKKGIDAGKYEDLNIFADENQAVDKEDDEE